MKNNTTYLQFAAICVPGFEVAKKMMESNLRLKNLSKSTGKNYLRKLAQVCLHYKKTPEHFSQEEINSYLLLKSKITPSLSKSEFKHTVYSLAFYYKSIGNVNMNIKLPFLKEERKLPTVLSKEECRRVFAAVKNVRKRLLLQVAYSGGMRINELCTLRLVDIDWHRRKIHIKETKGRKDRYVPLSGQLLQWLSNYIKNEKPVKFLFNSRRGKAVGKPYIRSVLNEAVKVAGIIKPRICMHTLRHSYATHLLEDGLNIVAIKELLGHSRIEATMVYLHVADYDMGKKHSPLDTLYEGYEADSEKDLQEIDTITKMVKGLLQHEIEMSNQLRLFVTEE